jgi:hypothetical protein
MSEITRRAALARVSTAAIATAAVSVPVVVAAAMPGEPDQCFLDWWAAYLVAERENGDAWETADLAWFAAKKHFPPMPAGLDTAYGSPGGVEGWRGWVEESATKIEDAYTRSSFLADCEDYAAACDPIYRAHDVHRLRAIQDEACDRYRDFSERIATTPANSLVGVVVKLRFMLRYTDAQEALPSMADAYEYDGGGGDEADRLAVSAWADLERLSGLPYDAAPWRLMSEGSQS